MLGLAPISIKRITDSTTEPVSLEQAKEHLRVIDFGDDDDYIGSLITAARHAVEKATRRALWTGQVWEAAYTGFGQFETVRGRLAVPKPPLVSVTGVSYYDLDGVLQTVSASDYVVDGSGSDRAIIGFKSTFGIPALNRDFAAPVRVAYTAGYADADAMPKGLVQAMLYLIQHYYDNRAPVGINVNLLQMPLTYQYLINQHTVPNRI